MAASPAAAGRQTCPLEDSDCDCNHKPAAAGPAAPGTLPEPLAETIRTRGWQSSHCPCAQICRRPARFIQPG